MSWTYPHTVTVKAISQTPDATTKVRGNPATAGSWTVQCDFQRLSSSQSFAEYGVDLNNGARAFVALTDAAKFVPEYTVTRGSETFVVTGSPILRDAGGSLDGAVVLLSGLQYPSTS